MNLFRKLMNIGQRFKALRQKIWRRGNKNRFQKQRSSTSYSSSSGTDSIERNKPSNASLMFYNRVISVPSPNSGAVLESHISSSRILAIFKEVEQSEDSTVLHSQKLKEAVKEVVENNPRVSYFELMKMASKAVTQDGSSQFTFAGVVDGVLNGVCAGESRLMVIRNGAAQFGSPRFRRRFKEPITSREVAAGVCEPVEFQFQLAEGDVIVFGCNGLWDNVVIDRIVALVNGSVGGVANYAEDSESQRENRPQFDMVFERLERELNKLIKKGMMHPLWYSPYSEDACSNGTPTSGGRIDSCCVLLSVVIDDRVWTTSVN